MIRLSTMARETPDATIEEVIVRAARLGLDGVDIHLSGMDRELSYLQKVRWTCLQHGLTIGYAGSGTFVGESEGQQERLSQGRRDVDAGALLGAQLLRVFARHAWPEDVTEQERLWGPMVDSFQQLADYAADQGVSLGLQNHDESSFCMTALQAKQILADVDRPNFHFLMDTGQWKGAIGSHPRGEFDSAVDLYEDYLRPMAAQTVYVRAKIYKIDGGREEWIDYRRVLGILRDANYNGTIGLVFELGDRNQCDIDEATRLAVAHLRDVIAEGA